MKIQKGGGKFFMKIWHPFTQHGLNEPIIEIETSKDEFLITKTGEKIIDGISSWWVNTLGHKNPIIAKAIQDEAQKLHQIIFAGFTHKPALDVAEHLKGFLPENFSRIFFSDSGSTSVEVALKMAVGYHFNRGYKRSKIVAMEHSYHGDTFGGMASGARSVFNEPYTKMLFDVERIPYPANGEEENTINYYRKLLEEKGDEIGAIILEPLVLGSGGMFFYKPFVIEELYKLSKKYGVIFCLDEVMTGFGRTGTMFAFNQTNIIPDIICLSKGLTGGSIPLAATVCTEEIYNAYLSDDKAKMFFHSSSYTANPVACAAAAANLEIWKNNDILKEVKRINDFYQEQIERFKALGCKNVRTLGDIFAYEVAHSGNDYVSGTGIKLYDFYRKNGILLRPLGNTVYVMPPYCIQEESLKKIFNIMEKGIKECL